MRDLAIYGFGGFGREVATLINALNQIEPMWNLIGFFDDNIPVGESNRYGTVLGGIDALNNTNRELSIVIAIANPQHIKSIVGKVQNSFVQFPNIIAPNVNIFDKETFKIGKGNLIFWGCRISCDVEIGDFNLLNGAVSLGHDVKMDNFNVLSPSVRISGDCMVGNSNFFGVQSVVLQGIKIGNDTKVGTMSVIMRNTRDNYLYFGNPAKRVENF